MTQVAGIGPARLQGAFEIRAFDVMTPDGFQQTVSVVRHMAIVTLAAGGFRRVMRMFVDLLTKGTMALKAGLVAIHARSQLIIGAALMHGMTREA